jgi:hypothetical protein
VDPPLDPLDRLVVAAADLGIDLRPIVGACEAGPGEERRGNAAEEGKAST